ncbi:MAG: hypothetical protein AAFQ95_06435 [Cyanobacteria bacterium J06621_3]
MSSSLQSLLPTLLVASPLLLGAAPSPTPSAIQQSCIETDAPQEATNSHIVHPVQSSQQVLITTRREWMTVNAAPVHSYCVTKEDPGEEPVDESNEEASDEVTPQPDATEGEIPELEPSAVPAPAQSTPPSIITPSTEAPIEQPATEAEATPIPTRTVAPPPSDPTLDPGNFTPTDAAPTPFDGSVVPTLESLPDGSYRYLSGEFEYGNYTDEQLTANGSAVFLLTKVGNEVTGNLSETFGQADICVTGTLSGNTITGAAYPIATDNASAVENVGEAFVPYGSGGLQVRQPQMVGDRTYYTGALLDLTTFSRINAGTALAPTACVVPTTDLPSDDDIESE